MKALSKKKREDIYEGIKYLHHYSGTYLEWSCESLASWFEGLSVSEFVR